jgi:hypothetical protein
MQWEGGIKTTEDGDEILLERLDCCLSNASTMHVGRCKLKIHIMFSQEGAKVD